MDYIPRRLEAPLQAALRRGKSVLLLGPRQTGKTTLLSRLAHDLWLSFVTPEVRLRYEKNPALLAAEVRALPRLPRGRRSLVLLDEVQKVPRILDVVQDLIDRDGTTFVLTGSSARKLRRGPDVNLLPGRVVALRLDPFTIDEHPQALEDAVLDGSLPGIALETERGHREQDLESYVTTYLEEEIRAEALVRNLGTFARFLEHAALASGGAVSFRAISQEIGVAHTTIAGYYEVLEDCLIAERIDPITASASRKKLMRSSKYLFFDLGVRRVCAREGRRPSRETLGRLFEQWVGLECLRHCRLGGPSLRLRFWRDPDGPEVDWVIDHGEEYTPIEAKWTDAPGERDARHLRTFLAEYPQARRGYVVCRTPRRLQLAPNVLAIPWSEIGRLFGA
ncbi:MAG TPA: AAA family ATPase [Polyangia bacterium]